jgi:hypothetical protein
MIPFLGITGHWINDNWQLKEALLDFRKLSGPHSGENMQELFIKCCKDLGIFGKVNNLEI